MAGPLQCFCEGLFNHKRYTWYGKHQLSKNGNKPWTEEEKEDKTYCFDYAKGSISGNIKGEIIKYLIIILNTFIRKGVIAIIEKLGYDNQSVQMIYITNVVFYC